MEYFEGLQFRDFAETDVMPFTRIMKRAFDEDARRHLGEESGGPPGYDNGDFLRKWALDKNSTAYAIFKETVPIGVTAIGVVIVWINSNNENFLGNIFVDPDFQDQGIGSLIWKFIEQKYSNTKVWRTETPGFSKRNHNFYVNKCGFKIVRIENPGNKYEESYILEKEITRA
ncbi:MAG: GNAT family N-acetyltransferase [Anaerolineae bacterium]|nr:GNAT family N-acetyltransferase [Anaerolineae bacterium]